MSALSRCFSQLKVKFANLIVFFYIHSKPQWLSLVVFLLVGGYFLFNFANKVFGQSQSSIDATVQISVCGNGEIEHSEQCDGTNLGGKTCTSFNYEKGPLACDAGCEYKVANCIPFVNFNGDPIIPVIASVQLTSTPTPSAIPTQRPTKETLEEFNKAIELNQNGDENFPPTELISPTPEMFATDSIVEIETNSSAEVASDQLKKTELKPPAQIAEVLQHANEYIDSFDQNNDQVIETVELTTITKSWTQAWRAISSNNEGQSDEEVATAVAACDMDLDAACNVKDFSLLMYYLAPENRVTKAAQP